MWEPRDGCEKWFEHFVAQGLSSREVAGQLFLSLRTIPLRSAAASRKLGITSAPSAASLGCGEHDAVEPCRRRCHAAT
jgi:DNA-binding NarL/FixJ family response regulator